jgi:hypothetical protein
LNQGNRLLVFIFTRWKLTHPMFFLNLLHDLKTIRFLNKRASIPSSFCVLTKHRFINGFHKAFNLRTDLLGFIVGVLGSVLVDEASSVCFFLLGVLNRRSKVLGVFQPTPAWFDSSDALFIYVPSSSDGVLFKLFLAFVVTHDELEIIGRGVDFALNKFSFGRGFDGWVDPFGLLIIVLWFCSGNLSEILCSSWEGNFISIRKLSRRCLGFKQ